MLSIHALMAPLVAFTPPSDEAEANRLILKISFLSPSLLVAVFVSRWRTLVLPEELRCRFRASQIYVHSRHKGCSLIKVMSGDGWLFLLRQVGTAAGRRQTRPVDGQTASSSYCCELVSLSWSH